MASVKMRNDFILETEAHCARVLDKEAGIRNKWCTIGDGCLNGGTLC